MASCGPACKISPRHHAVVIAYLSTPEMTKQRAYETEYRARGASSRASSAEMFARDDVKACMAHHQNSAAEKAEISKAELLRVLAGIATRDPDDPLDTDGKSAGAPISRRDQISAAATIGKWQGFEAVVRYEDVTNYLGPDFTRPDGSPDIEALAAERERLRLKLAG